MGAEIYYTIWFLPPTDVCETRIKAVTEFEAVEQLREALGPVRIMKIQGDNALPQTNCGYLNEEIDSER